MQDIFQGLNERQLEAVTHTRGSLLVLAGAGTGKTRVLVTRIAHMLQEGIPAKAIMAVTFTNKAAREMKDRLEKMAGPEAHAVRLGTFHSLCARFLRIHGEAVGLPNNFTIIDAADQLRASKQVLADAGVDEKKWPAKQFAANVSRLKDKGISPENLHNAPEAGFADGGMQRLYTDYQRLLRNAGSADFGDLLLLCLELFNKHPDILSRYHETIRYLLVDEYQDTNVAQYLWLRLLAQKYKNVCCVGDDDQSIYGWRGAEVGNILRFDRDFPDSKTVRLEQNYRSTGAILGAASGLIACNGGRLGKTLWTDGEQGEPVRVIQLWDDRDEARAVADDIETLRHDGTARLQDCAVLVRAGAQTRLFEENFVERGIPYRIIGGLRFYERQEIRDMIAYLRIVNQESDDLALERIINLPKRGIGAATLRNIRAYARDRNMSCMTAIREALHGAAGAMGLRTGVLNTLRGFCEKLDSWREAAQTLPVHETAERIADESGYAAMWQAEKTIEAQGRLENIGELFRALERFESLGAFLEHVSLVAEGEEESDADGQGQVNVMTLHAAKGLEFLYVFLPGWEEGIFPNHRAIDESGTAGLEEERRLAYVGITRARKRATILHASNRLQFGSVQQNLPSRFAEELPEEHIIRENRARDRFAAYEGGGSFSASGAYSGGSSIPKATKEIRRSPAGFAVGDRVNHKSFGYGTVLSLDSNRLDIFFDKAGRKKMMDDFVEKATA